MPPLHRNYRQVFVDLKPAMRGWRSTVDPCTQDRQVRKYIQECDKLLQPEHISQIKTTTPYIEGEKAIVYAALGKTLSLKEYTAARDLLIVKFTLATGMRPGPLNNAVITDYEMAKETDGNQIILIPIHKRSKDGLAILGMDKELQHQMAIYTYFN